jgi:hypothetical protein
VKAKNIYFAWVLQKKQLVPDAIYSHPNLYEIFFVGSARDEDISVYQKSFTIYMRQYILRNSDTLVEHNGLYI